MLISLEYQHPRNSLEAAMIDTLQALKKRRYNSKGLYRYSRIFKHLLQFAFDTGADQLSEDLTTRFVQKYSVANGRDEHRIHMRTTEAACAIRMLSSIAFTGTCASIHPFKPLPVLPKFLTPEMESFLSYWKRDRQVSLKTLDYGRWILTQFILFAYGRGLRSWSDFKPDLCTKFFSTKTQYSPRSLRLMSTVLRVFFRYHFSQGTMTLDWSYHLPQFRGFNNQRIPAIWPEAAVNSLLAAVDRSYPKGKRDYAILLLACRLGIRAGDIRDLRFDNLNWDDASIEFRQGKTKRKTMVPLTNEIGDAIIDYLQNGRPTSDCREIFLRSYVPFTPLSKNNKLYGIIDKYRQLAGVELPEQACGMHSLRHTFANRLLNAGNTLETISDLMGHASLDTTSVYTRVDVEQLRHTALDEEILFHG